MCADNVAFLELDRDKYVHRRDRSKEQVAAGHSRRRPECDNEAKHDRVTHKPVKERRSKSEIRIFFALPVHINLAQPEEIKMIDHECAQQHDSPAKEEESP